MSRTHSSYLDHILPHLNSARLNSPQGYIDYIKQQPRFSDGGLKDLPTSGIILHDTRLEEHLAIMGVDGSRLRKVNIGTTDPNIFYIVYGNAGSQDSFILNRGMPGGGGITTQAAELAALGVKRIVHIGTCALMGPAVPEGQVVVSTGSYKDGAAAFLSSSNENDIDPVARPNADLSKKLEHQLQRMNVAFKRSCGYTIPTFYFQPESLIRSLVTGSNLPGPQKVGHLEMEQAGLFALANLMGFEAASLVVGSDRYLMNGDTVEHSFEADFDQDDTERQMISATLNAFFDANFASA